MSDMLCGSWENTYPFWSVLFCLLPFLLEGGSCQNLSTWQVFHKRLLSNWMTSFIHSWIPQTGLWHPATARP